MSERLKIAIAGDHELVTHSLSEVLLKHLPCEIVLTATAAHYYTANEKPPSFQCATPTGAAHKAKESSFQGPQIYEIPDSRREGVSTLKQPRILIADSREMKKHPRQRRGAPK